MNKDEKQYYNQIRNIIIKHSIFQNVKDYSKEKEKSLYLF